MRRFAIACLTVLSGCSGETQLASSRTRDASPESRSDVDRLLEASTAMDEGPKLSQAPDASGEASIVEASVIDFSVDVVRSPRIGSWVPAGGALVHLEGRSGSVELTTDAAGRAATTLDPTKGPWDATIALVGHTVISILDVSGPIAGRVHLNSKHPIVNAPRRALSGAITGRTSQVGDVELEGPAALLFEDHGTTYTATVREYPDLTTLHFLALDWPNRNPQSPPVNAVWLDVPVTGGDLTADIHFPTPPRRVTRTTMTVQAPSSGAVVGGQLLPPSPESVYRREKDWSYTVGSSTYESVSAAPGRFTWVVEAFDGDMAPFRVSADFRDAAEEHEVFVDTTLVANGVIDVPGAETLEAVGTGIDTLSMSWSAPGHSRVGASLVPNGPTTAGSWYVYSFDGATIASHPWPHLPAGMSLTDVDLADPNNLKVNVFAQTLDDSTEPWDFTGHGGQRAVIHSRLLVATPPAADGGKPTPPDTDGGKPLSEASVPDVKPPPPPVPLDTYNGIYSLVDVTLNASSCDAEGPSILSQFTEPLFLAEDDPPYDVKLMACADPADCRARAAAYRDFKDINGLEWEYSAAVPGDPLLLTIRYSSQPDQAGLCSKDTLETGSLSGDPGKTLRAEIHIVDVPAFPPDASSACTAEAASSAAAAIACSELKVFTGRFQEAL